MAIVYQGAVALAAQGTLTVSEQALAPSNATIPGDTTYPGAATYVTEVISATQGGFIPGPSMIPGAALIPGPPGLAGDALALRGETSLAEAPLYTGRGAVALSGTTTLATPPTQTMVVGAGLTATTSLAEAPWMTYGARAVSLDGVTALSLAPLRTLLVAAALAGSGTLTAASTVKRPTTVPTLTGVVSLSLAPLVTLKGASSTSLSATTTLPVAGLATAVAIETFAGATNLSLAPLELALVAVTLPGQGVLTPGAALTAQTAATLPATSALTEVGTYVGVASVALTGVTGLNPHALATYYLHTVPTLTGVTGLVVRGHFEWLARGAVLTAAASLGAPLAVRVRLAIVALVATAELEAEAWVHTLIPPGFTPSPIATVDTTPTWHLYIADTITGKIGYELPVVTQQWESKLNDIGTAQATINVDQAYHMMSSWDERDPRVLFRQFLSGPLRYSGVFAYGDQAVWAGPLGPVSVPGNSPQIQIGFTEFSYMLTKRLMLGDRNDPVGNGDLSFGPATTQQIAWDIIQQATGPGLASYGLPVYLRNLATGGPNDMIRTYYGFDFSTVWDALAALTAEANGPDIRFDPVLSYKPDGLYLSYDLQIGSPLIYSDTTWAWDVPANATVQWDTNMQNFATSYWGMGAGQDRTKLAAFSENQSLYDLGFPAIEMSDALHSSVTDPYQLQALIDGDMLVYQQPAVKWTVKTQGSIDPLIGSYRVGDIFVLTVQDHPAVPDGTYRRRITGLAGDQSDWVSVSSSDAYTVMATTTEGVQVITNQ